MVNKSSIDSISRYIEAFNLAKKAKENLDAARRVHLDCLRHLSDVIIAWDETNPGDVDQLIESFPELAPTGVTDPFL